MEIPKITIKRWTVPLTIGLILLGIGWRLIPHVPNFAPIGAIALLGGIALGWRTSLWLMFTILVSSDLVLGFYSGMEWTWLSFGLIISLATLVKRLPAWWRIPIGAFGSSAVFFIVSNFGTWVASGMYSHDIMGFVQCYVAALPFYKATVLSDLLFGALLLSAYEVAPKIAKIYRHKNAKTHLISLING